MTRYRYDMIMMIIAFKGATRDIWQSPHCAANRLQHVRSSGADAIVCKPHATRRAPITRNMSCCVSRGRKGQLSYWAWQSLNRIYLNFTLLARPLTDERIPYSALPQWAIPHSALPQWAIPHSTLPQWAIPHSTLPQWAIPHSALPLWAIPHSALPQWAIPHCHSEQYHTLLCHSEQYHTLPQWAIPHSTLPQWAIPHSALPQWTTWCTYQATPVSSCAGRYRRKNPKKPLRGRFSRCPPSGWGGAFHQQTRTFSASARPTWIWPMSKPRTCWRRS